MGFLDNAGLTTLWNKIVGRSIPYGYCQTAKGTVAKTVTVSPAITELTTGLTIAVRFQYENTSTNPTLKVNTTDAKAIKRYGTTSAGTSATASWQAGEVRMLTYNGSYWMLCDWNNTSYSGMTDAEVNAGTSETNRLITPARLKYAIQHWETGEANVQSDWSQTDDTADDYIKNKPTIPSGVSPYTSDPSMDGTASAGSSNLYARGDHVHPSDTSRVPTTRTVNGHALSSNVTVGVNDITVPRPVGQQSINLGSWITSTESLISSLDEQVADKVDAEDGKGLSTNDYTTTEKNKLAGIASGAEVNVQADWNESDTTSDAYILNKPTILEPLIGTSANITPSQVISAIAEGRDVVITHSGDIDGIDTTFTFTAWNRATDIDYSGAMLDVVVSYTIAALNSQFYLYELVGGTFQGIPMSWTLISTILAKKTDIPTNVSAFNNDVGYLRSESDPTVPAWAKASSKPTYTASEVGAQETLVSGTNIKTINGDSILGSGNLVVSGGGSEPTMQTLSVTSGGTGTWHYRTWASGWQEAWYQGSIQFTSASSSAGGWNRSTKNFALPISFADNASILVSGSTSGRVYTHGGIKTSGTQFEAQILGGASLSANTYSGWSVYVAGYGRT